VPSIVRSVSSSGSAGLSSDAAQGRPRKRPQPPGLRLCAPASARQCHRLTCHWPPRPGTLLYLGRVVLVVVHPPPLVRYSACGGTPMRSSDRLVQSSPWSSSCQLPPLLLHMHMHMHMHVHMPPLLLHRQMHMPPLLHHMQMHMPPLLLHTSSCSDEGAAPCGTTYQEPGSQAARQPATRAVRLDEQPCFNRSALTNLDGTLAKP